MEFSGIVKPKDSRLYSHGFALPDAVELAKIITGLPVNIIIYGVEPLDFSFGKGLSTPVQKALPKVTEAIDREIHSFLKLFNT